MFYAVAALAALLASSVGAAEWIGKTEETFDPPERSGLSRPRVLETVRPYAMTLDLDRDGDLDVVHVYRGAKRGLIETLCRRASNRLASVWKGTTTPRTEGPVTGIFAARVTEDRWPNLIIEVAGPPYLASFAGQGNAAFAGKPEWLDRRFPARTFVSGGRVEPYVGVLDMADWDGDGFEDILTLVADAAIGEGGQLTIRRHGIYALFGGKRWGTDAVEVLDLAKLGSTVRVLALRDLDGDGSFEILLEVEALRANAIRSSELLFLRKEAKLSQEATWQLAESHLVASLGRDLNGDGIPDAVCADYRRNHFLLLTTQRQTGRGFSFAVQRVTMPAESLAGDPDKESLFYDDLNGDGTIDFFTVSSYHNQVHLVLRRPSGEAQPALVYLPQLPRGKPVTSVGWYDKAVWFGDLDGDGTNELLVLTNQVLNPDFVPPRLSHGKQATPDTEIESILRANDERTRYAPYFRLLVYRVREQAVDLVAKLNTFIPARQCRPARIELQDVDGDDRPDLLLEVTGVENERATQAFLKVTGTLPRSPFGAPAAGAPKGEDGKAP